MSADRDAFYKLFESGPGDPFTAYGAMADVLDEIGYAKLAHAFRWMCFRKVSPHKRTHYPGRNVAGRRVPKSAQWAWYASQLHDAKTASYPREPLAHHALPKLVILNHPQKTFGSHQEAVMWLADKLAALQVEYAVHPPKPKGLALIDTLDVTGIRVPPLFTDEVA